MQVIGHQNVHVIAGILADILPQCSRSHILGMKESQPL